MIKSMVATAGAFLLLSTVYALPEIFIARRDAKLVAKSSELTKREGGTLETTVSDLLSPGLAYYVNVTVGTPPQLQSVLIDTGSADLFFDAFNASACNITGPNLCIGGTFDSSRSTSFDIVNASPGFNNLYGDGSIAAGPMGKDLLGLGDVVIQDVQFGVAEVLNNTNAFASGTMGLGFDVQEGTKPRYPNIPDVLVDAGVINSRLYSVLLGDASEPSGTILFGGLDTTKFTGPLVTVNMQRLRIVDQLSDFLTTVSALSVKVSGRTTPVFNAGSNVSQSLSVIIDTGSTAWFIDTDYYTEHIAPLFPFVDSNNFLPCDHLQDDISLTVTFADSINITVPGREFIVPVYNDSNAPVFYPNSTTEACAFLLVPAPPYALGYQTIGDAILKSMYVVYDLDNGQMSFAQAAVNSTEPPSVLAVSAGPSGVASAMSSASRSYQPAEHTNTNSVPAAVSPTASFVVSTLASTIGTATGTAAVPADGQASNATCSAQTVTITVSATTSDSVPISSAHSGNGTASATGSGSVPISSGYGGNGSFSGTASGSLPTSYQGAASGVVVPRVEWSLIGTAGMIGSGLVFGLGLLL